MSNAATQVEMHPVIREAYDKVPTTGTAMVSVIGSNPRVRVAPWYSIKHGENIGSEAMVTILTSSMKRTLQLKLESDRIIYAFLSTHPLVTGEGGNVKRVLVHNPQLAAIEDNTKTDHLLEVLMMIKGMSHDELVDNVLLVAPSATVRSSSAEVLRRLLDNMAKNDAEGLLRKLSAPDKEVSIVFQKALQSGQISHSGGVYKLRGTEVMGTSLDASIAWLKGNPRVLVAIKTEVA